MSDFNFNNLEKKLKILSVIEKEKLEKMTPIDKLYIAYLLEQRANFLLQKELKKLKKTNYFLKRKIISMRKKTSITKK